MSGRVLAPTDRYEACVNDGGKEHLLGTGAYGEVVLVRKRGAGYRAMKRCVDCLSPSDPCTLKRMYREIAVLRQVHHDNIIALTDVFLPHVGHDLFLFFQAASCDLEHAIRYNMLDELAQQSIGCDVIRALAYLHASDLIHRDLKPSNVLLDESGAKLCDFGLVRLIGLYPKGLTEYVGMRWYRAPELFLGSRCYNQSIDVARSKYSRALALNLCFNEDFHLRFWFGVPMSSVVIAVQPEQWRRVAIVPAMLLKGLVLRMRCG